jgi:HEAT repeat protein
MMTSDSHPLTADRAEEMRYRRVQEQSHLPLQKCRSILFAALADTSWRVRKLAIDVLLAARPGEEDIHQLIALMRDEENAGLRNATAELLVRLGAGAVPLLLAYLDDDDHDLRKLVVDTLGLLGGEEAITGLIRALSDPDLNVAAAAAEGLGVAGNARSVPELVHHLEQNQEPFFRFNALAALGRIGVSGPLPAVIRPLAQQDILCRAVYECLGRIGGDLEAVDLLLDGTVSHLPSLRQAAIISLAHVLQHLDPVAQNAARQRMREVVGQGLLDQLTALFSPGNLVINAAVVTILGVLADPRGIKVLFRALADERLSEGAKQAIKALGTQAVPAASACFSESDNPAERAALCAFLGDQPGDQAAATIRCGLRDADAEVRTAAVSAAARRHDPELPSLAAVLLEDDNAAVREAALSALCRYADSDRDLIGTVAGQLQDSVVAEQRRGATLLFAALHDNEQLARLLKDEDATVRAAAARAAGRLKPIAACSHLKIALVDEEPDVRIAAADVLGACRDVSAVLPLRLLLEDSDIWVQAAALRSLVQLAGKDALPDLLRLWEQGNEVVQLVCLESFELIGASEGLEAVAHNLGHYDGEVLKGAIELLHRHAGSLLNPWLHQLISHAEWDVRITAVRASTLLPDNERVKLLQRALEREEHTLVRAEIRLLLGMA